MARWFVLSGLTHYREKFWSDFPALDSNAFLRNVQSDSIRFKINKFLKIENGSLSFILLLHNLIIEDTRMSINQSCIGNSLTVRCASIFHVTTKSILHL